MNNRLKPSYGNHVDFTLNLLLKRVADLAVAPATLPYKSYVAVLAQTGSGTPTATILENTLGGTVTIGRTIAGAFTLTTAGLFTLNKTFVNITSGVGFISSGGYSSSANTVDFWTQTNSVDGTVDAANRLQIEVRVYN